MSKYLEYKQKLKQAPPIDNPYLDAILRCIMDLEDRIENDNVLMLGRMDIEKLIELVDRATPKKPIKNGSGDDCCPNCHSLEVQISIGFGQDLTLNFCQDCGQAIDWSDDEG